MEQPVNNSLLPDLPDSENLDFPSQADFEPPSNLPKLPGYMPDLPDFNTSIALQNSPIYQNELNLTNSQEMQKSQFEQTPTMNIHNLPPPRIPLKPEIKAKIKSKIRSHSKTSTENTKPIYVRLDKFESTIEFLDEIKNKIQDIEEILKKTKETKLKEDQELETWEAEIQIIKLKIESIDQNLFDKIE